MYEEKRKPMSHKWKMRTKAVSALLCFSVDVGNKTLTRSNLEEMIYFILYFQVTTVHHRKKPEQEPGAGTWDRDKGTMPTGLLAMPFSAYFLTPPMTTPRTHWTLWQQSSIKKMLPQTCWQVSLMGQFLSWGSLFLGDSSLCPVGKTLTITERKDPSAISEKNHLEKEKKSHVRAQGL